MSQKFKILRNQSFTANTLSIGESLNTKVEFNQKYFLDTEYSNDVEITSEYSIRSFLEKESSQSILKGFNTYLSGNSVLNSTVSLNLFTPTSAFKEIYYNDKKLSNVFNSYYNNVMSESTSLDFSIGNELMCDENCSTYEINIFDNLFVYGNSIMNVKNLQYIPLDFSNFTRDTNSTSKLVYVDENDGYYISFFIPRTTNVTSIQNYKFCEKILFNFNSSSSLIDFDQNDDFDEIINTEDVYEITPTNQNFPNRIAPNFNIQPTYTIQPLIDFTVDSYESTNLVQCFVDLNLNGNENIISGTTDPATITFDTDELIVEDGIEYQTTVSLNRQAFGYEKVTVTWLLLGIGLNEIVYGVPPSLSYVINFNPGQTEYIFKIKTKLKICTPLNKVMKMSLGNYYELVPGEFPSKTFHFPTDIIAGQDTSERSISFQGTGEEIVVDGHTYVLHDDFIYDGEEYSLGEFSDTMVNEYGSIFLINIIMNDRSLCGAEKCKLEFDKGTTFNENEDDPDWKIWWWNGGFGSGGIYPNLANVEFVHFSAGEIIKQLAIQIPKNVDVPPDVMEYFNIKLTDFQDVHPGEYIGTQVQIKDYTIGEPDCSCEDYCAGLCTCEECECEDDTNCSESCECEEEVPCSCVDFCAGLCDCEGEDCDCNCDELGEYEGSIIPDYYYTTLSDVSDIEDSLVLKYMKAQKSVGFDYKIGTEGPRFRGYFFGGLYDYSQNVQHWSDWFNESTETIFDINGKKWRGATVPCDYTGGNFTLSDINCFYRGNYAHDAAHDPIQPFKVAWNNTNEYETVHSSIGDMSGVTSNSGNSVVSDSGIEIDGAYFENGTIINGGSIEALNDVDSNGNILIGPPLYPAQAGPELSVVDDGSGGLAIEADYETDHYRIQRQFAPNDYPASGDINRLQYSSYDIFYTPGLRFLLKADIVNIDDLEHALFYLASGVRKGWEAEGGFFNLVWYSQQIQKQRKVDGNGDVWEWCYRMASPIIPNATPEMESGNDPSILNDEYCGWGWYKMMNLNTGNAFLINEDTSNDLNDSDGFPKDGVIFDDINISNEWPIQAAFVDHYRSENS